MGKHREMFSEIRSIESPDNNDLLVEGYALKFNSPTQIYEGTDFEYTETIAPGALDNTNLSNVVLNVDHDDKQLLARTTNDTLKLSIDEIGLKITANITKTPDGQTVYRKVKEKLYDKMSFRFKDIDFDNPSPNEMIITGIKLLRDVSIVTFPAYSDTSIETLRSAGYDDDTINKIQSFNRNTEQSEAVKEANKKDTEEVSKRRSANMEFNIEKLATASQVRNALETNDNARFELQEVKRALVEDMEKRKEDLSVEDMKSLNDKHSNADKDLTMLNTRNAMLQTKLDDLQHEIGKVKVTGERGKEYLESQESVQDFGEMLVRSQDKEAFRYAWTKHLQSRGISNPEAFTPTPIVSAITDCFKENGDILRMTNRLVVKEWKVLLETGGEIGLGHKPGNAKKEQTLTFDPIQIMSAYVYKFQNVDRVTEQDGGQALISFLTTEMPQRLVEALERAVLIGDGLADAAVDKIKEVKAIVDADATYVTEVTGDITMDTLEDLYAEIDTISDSNLAAVMSKKTYSDFKKMRTTNGDRQFEIGTVVKNGKTYDTLDGRQIIKRNYMDSDTVQTIIMADFSGYTFISLTATPEVYKAMKIDFNTNQYLVELRCGGNVAKCKSASFIKKPLV